MGLGLAATAAAELGAPKPLWIVVLVVAAALVVYAIYPRKGTAMANEGSGNVNITSHHQSGGITAHTVNVTAPQTSVHGRVAFENRPAEDKYLTQARFSLDAPYAARQGLQVEVHGSAIEALDVTPDLPAAMISMSTDKTTPTRARTVIHPPLANEYIANVTTASPDTINVGAMVA